MPDDFYSRIIDSIIDTRKEKGFTQKELAAACGLTQSVIARIESKKSVPTLATLCKIVYALDSTIQIVNTASLPA